MVGPGSINQGGHRCNREDRLHYGRPLRSGTGANMRAAEAAAAGKAGIGGKARFDRGLIDAVLVMA